MGKRKVGVEALAGKVGVEALAGKVGVEALAEKVGIEALAGIVYGIGRKTKSLSIANECAKAHVWEITNG